MPTRVFLVAVFSLCLMTAGSGFRAQQTMGADTHVRQLLDEARSALGGSSALQSIRSLSAAGSFIVGEGEHRATGQMTLDLLLPGMYMRTMKWSPTKAVTITEVEAVAGDKVWSSSKAAQGYLTDSISMGGGGMGGGRSRTGGRGGAGSDAPPEGEAAPELRQDTHDPAFQAQMRADLQCMLIALFLNEKAFPPERYSLVGEDVLAGTGVDMLKFTDDKQAVYTLALDQKTHRPFMVGYQSTAAQTAAGARPRRLKQGDIDTAMGSVPPETADLQIYFSDYRPVQDKKTGTVWLPHQINKTSNGASVDDFHLETFRINPSLKPEQFEEKKSSGTVRGK